MSVPSRSVSQVFQKFKEINDGNLDALQHRNEFGTRDSGTAVRQSFLTNASTLMKTALSELKKGVSVDYKALGLQNITGPRVKRKVIVH